MAERHKAAEGINSWLEEELYREYLHDHNIVDESWKTVFESNGEGTPAAAAGGELEPLRGAAARLAGNMEASLAIPTATSQRTIPIKVADENRTIVNQHLSLVGGDKVSYTHLIGWAIVKALKAYPNLNSSYAERDGAPHRRVPPQLNLGVAVDVAGKDGAHSLLVPNIKGAGALDFRQFVAAFDDTVGRARTNKLAVEDFQGTTITLTNPGTVGTLASVPRLMPGQGAIVATGAIDYPAEYRGASPDTRAQLGIGKVMTMTCTYDHRVIQGAESGLFLAKVQALLQGEDNFYDEIFADLRLPYHPVRWEPDRVAIVPGGGERGSEIAKQAAVLQLINAYRVRGHLIADLDPLGAEPSYHPELDPANYGLTIWDLDREFITGSLGEAIGGGQPFATLRQILETVRQTYCGKIGCEYMNIQVPEQKRWLQHRMEPTANSWPLDAAVRRRILERLLQAEEFEHFLHARFVGHKRFSLEGAEAAMAILDETMRRAASSGVHEIVIGMAHRGRLNVLANLVGKPLAQIFSAFEMEEPMSAQGSGDVKYHLGASGVRTYEDGTEIVVSVSPNPSHLEAVDPVVEGIVRPKQDRLGDTKRQRVIPLLIHGDAAFAGQGVVAETLNLSQLDGYSTGGTVHLIINNQIGFTTPPEEARSTPYSTDVARMVQAPILHVNGDDPEACARAAHLAFDFRQEFARDVVIDMFCYRRHGHNEADDPSYTQPILYKKIREHPSVAVLYSERLLREGLVAKADIDAIRKRAATWLSESFAAAQKGEQEFEVQELTPVAAEESAGSKPNTAAERATLERVIAGLARFPADFRLHPKLRGFVDRRLDAFAKGGPIDWSFAETLAFGSLVVEGTPVRLSGQDSSRGTFTQRHANFYDYETGRKFCPLSHLTPEQARFDVYDSLLSEEAVLGFEFGYSLGDPLTLVLWEAQFGDFADNAQGIIDEFIAGSDAKWGQPSGLVLLLPHGYEGQGPDHSSARIERFLQLAAEGNLQVAYPTTPAQYFHLLRRQMFGGPDRRGLRKPLVVFTPKSLLRHPRAVSRVEELAGGGFREVMGDTGAIEAERVTRVLLSTGKVYYDLAAAREEKQADNVALVRVEQIYPFAYADVQDVLLRYPLTAEVFWVQEEPRNMGAWRYIHEQVQPLIAQTRRVLGYVGRPDSAATATGSHRRHEQEQRETVETAFASGARSNIRVIGRKLAR